MRILNSFDLRQDAKKMVTIKKRVKHRNNNVSHDNNNKNNDNNNKN